MPWELTPARRAALRGLVDAVVPPLPAPPGETPDRAAFWSTGASALGAHLAIEQALAERVDPEVRAGLEQLLDGMSAIGIAHLPPATAEVVIATAANLGPEATLGVAVFRGLAAMFAYGLVDAEGRNPLWAGLGYPGPVSAAPDRPHALVTESPAAGSITTDVCVIGSGAGGGVIAAELAARGLSVVVLEAGGHFEERDFSQIELWAYANLYWRGGPTPTVDGNVSILAGGAVGGGTTVNWTNCVPTPAHVRVEWEQEHGLEGLAGAEFDNHSAAVLDRISATAACSDHNGPHRRLAAGAAALGWSMHDAQRNTDPATYDPVSAGYLGFGDQSGSKQSTLKTYLPDAAAAGARILVHTRADRILVEGGRATGVAAVCTDPATGGTAEITVRASQVVVAAGALETPAILLRSGIGGPAVGRNLHLHPSVVMFGTYDEPQDPWWGPPQAAVMDEFAATWEEHGFLVEGVQYGPALLAAYLPWRGGSDHKRLIAEGRATTGLVAVCRDRGSGTVTLGPDGEGVVAYPFDDTLDRKVWREAVAALARLHAAGGAHTIHSAAPGIPSWRRGEDLDAWIATVQGVPPGAGGHPVGCAHQMGTARMGTDRMTSVADPSGRLHDTAGVWIGDTSAFPSASGANPMLTCMALARRTAVAVAEAAAASSAPTPSEVTR